MKWLWAVLGVAGILSLVAGDALAQGGRGRGRCRGQGWASAPTPPAPAGQGQTAADRTQGQLRLRDGSCGACPAGNTDCTNCDLCPRLRDGSCPGGQGKCADCPNCPDCPQLHKGRGGPAATGAPIRAQQRLRDGSCGTCPLR